MMPNQPYFSLSHDVACKIVALCGPKALAVYVAIGVYAGANRVCWPSLASVGHMCGIKLEKTVSQEIAKLIATGAISRKPRAYGFEYTIVRHASSTKDHHVTKEWLKSHCRLKATAIGTYLFLRAFARLKATFRQRADEMALRAKLSRPQFDRIVSKLEAVGLIETAHLRRLTLWVVIENLKRETVHDTSTRAAHHIHEARTPVQARRASSKTVPSGGSASSETALDGVCASSKTAPEVHISLTEVHVIQSPEVHRDQTPNGSNGERCCVVPTNPSQGNSDRSQPAAQHPADCDNGWIVTGEGKARKARRCPVCLDNARRAKAIESEREAASRQAVGESGFDFSDMFREMFRPSPAPAPPTFIDAEMLPPRRSERSVAVVPPGRFEFLREYAEDYILGTWTKETWGLFREGYGPDARPIRWTKKDYSLLREVGVRTLDWDDDELAHLLDEVSGTGAGGNSPANFFACALRHAGCHDGESMLHAAGWQGSSLSSLRPPRRE